MNLTILLCLFLVALPVMAQLPAPNAAGATAGHEIFSAKDQNAANRFWAALGGEPATLVRLNLIKFPGELLLVGAQRPNGRVERQDEGIAAIVGIELGFPITFRIDDKSETRGPHVVEEL